MRANVAVLACGMLLSGCASSLVVWNDTAEQKGVPFRAAEVYLQRGIYKTHSEVGEACTPAPFEKTVSLATGAQYFANVKPAIFAKTEFSMTFADGGALTGITMNTEPVAADTITAASDALTSLLPFAGVVARQPDTGGGDDTPPQGATDHSSDPLPACDAGPTGVTYTRFQATAAN